MAGKKPFFLTGAVAKIKVNGVNLAFCTNISYSVTVNHAAPRVLGMYEPTSIEPTGYLVTGSLSIVKYTADAKSLIANAPNDTTDRGNGIGSWARESSSVKRLADGFDIKGGIDGRAYHNLLPRHLNKATGFDIEIFHKLDGKDLPVAKIREARITRADFNVSKQSAASQTFQFTALYADEDTFLADFSGTGQQFV